MQDVFNYLNQIREFLEQIDNITDNQMTILVGDLQNIEEENSALELIEDMVNCKDELISDLTQVEEYFQREYDKHRETLIKNNKINVLKGQVQHILQLKEEIARKEHKNMLIMQKNSNKRIDRVIISPSSNQVVEAYKKQQRKS
ncbi:MAG: hypothetical protein J6F30_17270 [Cellulosilyticum sp.]|nr:hypothetical protein [Cellulosilyticum sp.]